MILFGHWLLGARKDLLFFGFYQPRYEGRPHPVGRTSWPAFFDLIARIRKADQEVRPTTIEILSRRFATPEA